MSTKYIAFYDFHPQTSIRNVSPAAVNKVEYISRCLEKVGHKVKIISPSWIVKRKNGLQEKPRSTSTLDVKFAPDLGYVGVLSNIINAIFVNLWLFYYIGANCKKGERLIVYHSLVIIPAIFLLKWIYSINVTLEVEELYTSVGSWRTIFKKIEKYYVKSIGSSYLLSTDVLEDQILDARRRAVVYGSYTLPTVGLRQEDISCQMSTRTKILYAGIIDKEKKGAFNALAAALHLDARYELHLIGFGQVASLKTAIERISKKTSCLISYDGQMSGIAFETYCSSFHIGLSTQASTGEYLASSFPSKILTYLSFGMRVVSPSIESVKKSSVGMLVSYYEDDGTGENLARAIKSINLADNFNSVEVIRRLDVAFVETLSDILPVSR